MEFNLDNDVKFILEQLNKYGTGFVVGGAVRDNLINSDPGDYDFATDIEYKELKKIFKDYSPKEVGAHFGILMIKVNGKSYEIAKFRKEMGVYNSRYPKEIKFVNNIEQDLQRRDFTINAMAYDGKSEIIDLYNGREDLKRKLIKFVGNPKIRIEEDALRIMRAFRFISKLGFNLDKKTEEAIIDKRNFLFKISKERIFDELSKILMGKYVKKALFEMRNLGILDLIIPEFRYTYTFDQYHSENKDILFNHIVKTVANCENDLITKLAALFHDLGKINTKYIDAKGQCYYYRHEIESSVIAEEKLKYLKASNDIINSVKSIILNHTIYENEVSDKILKKLIIELESKNIDRLFDLLYANFNSKLFFRENEKMENIDKLLERVKVLQNSDIPNIRSLDITGVDLMNLNFDSKEIGKIKSEIYELILDDEIKNDKEEIIKYLTGKYNLDIKIGEEKSCGALIYNPKTDKILIVKMYNGNWGFPKGHVENEETEEETAHREVFEETGVKIEILDGFKQSIKYIPNEKILKEVVFFIGIVNDDKVVIDKKEIQDFKWCDYDKAFKLVTYKLQREVLENAKKFIDFKFNSDGY